MKKSPDQEKLEQTLRSSKLVAGGFLGTDTRDLTEIIDADAAAVARHDKTNEQIADRMTQITEAGLASLGFWIDLDDHLQVLVDEAKGILVCPWPHGGRFAKRVTLVTDKRTGTELQWSDLNIHLIEAHSFYEGKGSPYRLDPETLINAIF